MTDIRARFIDALAQHLICDCGEWADNLDETAAHLADVLLALEGVAVVELPSLPSSQVRADDIWVLDESWHADRRFYPANARRHAAALLAAAAEVDR